MAENERNSHSNRMSFVFVATMMIITMMVMMVVKHRYPNRRVVFQSARLLPEHLAFMRHLVSLSLRHVRPSGRASTDSAVCLAEEPIQRRRSHERVPFLRWVVLFLHGPARRLCHCHRFVLARKRASAVRSF